MNTNYVFILRIFKYVLMPMLGFRLKKCLAGLDPPGGARNKRNTSEIT